MNESGQAWGWEMATLSENIMYEGAKKEKLRCKTYENSCWRSNWRSELLLKLRLIIVTLNLCCIQMQRAGHWFARKQCRDALFPSHWNITEQPSWIAPSTVLGNISLCYALRTGWSAFQNQNGDPDQRTSKTQALSRQYQSQLLLSRSLAQDE